MWVVRAFGQRNNNFTSSLRSALYVVGILGGLIVPLGCDLLKTPSHRQTHRQQRETIAQRFEQVQMRLVSDANDSAGLLTLERAVQEALEASFELDQIFRRIEAAHEQIKQAQALFYPRLVLSEEFGATDNPVFGMMHIINQRRLEPGTNFNDPGWQHNFSTRVRGDISLFDGGIRSAQRSFALDQRLYQEAELRTARNKLVSSVNETYYRWLQAMIFLQVAERALQHSRTNERLAQARVSAEAALPSEVLRLKTRTAESRGNLLSTRISIRRFQAALERLLARQITPEEVPDPNVYATPLDEEISGSEDLLIAQALKQRPEMEAVAYLIQAAQARVEANRGEHGPKVGAFAQYQLDSERGRLFDDSWMFGVEAGLPLFEGGLTRARVRQAQAQFREIESRGRQIALDIALEVYQARLTLEEANSSIEVAQQRRNWAQRALDETQHLYAKEAVTVEALLQAELEWNRSEAAYTKALFDGKIAVALLQQALGDFAGWIETNEQ